MESYLRELVRGRPADYVEVRLEETHVTNVSFRGPVLDQVGETTSFGGNVRALVNGGWGFVSFTRLEDLEAKVALAIRQAELVSRERPKPLRLAPVPVVRDIVRPEVGEDPRRVPLSAKKELLEGYNRQIMAWGPPIVTSSVSYFDRHRHIRFANSEGTYIDQELLDVAGVFWAAAARGGVTQIRHYTFGSSSTFGVARGLEAQVEEVCRKAAALLDAPVVQGGVYPVILDPQLAGVFVHEAFGHLSEADNVDENPNLQKVMTLGREFGGPHLHIYDSGSEPGLRGYLRYDDEGVPTRKTYLVREGKLVGRLHSRETAAKMGEEPTGNARAVDWRFPPICRMRTTGIEPGEASFEEMLEGIELGVYAVGSYGGQTAGEMFTFTAGEAYMVRNGKLAEMVRDVTLTGNVFETLRNIDLIGRDPASRDGPGGCGKGEQAPLAVSFRSPHIRIQNVVVGGVTR